MFLIFLPSFINSLASNRISKITFDSVKSVTFKFLLGDSFSTNPIRLFKASIGDFQAFKISDIKIKY